MKIHYYHMLLVFVLLPLISRSLVVGLFPDLYLPPIFQIFVFAAGAAILLTKTHSRQTPNSVFLPLFAFVLFGFLSVAWSLAVDISIQRAAFNSIVILFLYIYARKTNPEIQFSIILWSCIFALFVVGIGSLPPYLLKDPVSYYQGNFRGYLNNSNSLGHYFSSAVFPLCLYWLFTSKKWKMAIVLILVILLAFFLIQTRSRGAFLAAFLAGLVIYFGVVKLTSFNMSTLVFPILAFIALIYFSEFSHEKYEGDNAFSTRSYLWLLHLQAIIERPILGWGVGVNPVDFKLYTGESYNYLSETEKGTSYYVLPEEIGIPFSLIVFVLFVPFFLKQVPIAFNYMRHHKEFRSGLLPLSIVMSGLLHGVFESWLFSFGNPMTVIFWLSCIYIAELSKNRVYIRRRLRVIPNRDGFYKVSSIGQ